MFRIWWRSKSLASCAWLSALAQDQAGWFVLIHEILCSQHQVVRWDCFRSGVLQLKKEAMTRRKWRQWRKWKKRRMTNSNRQMFWTVSHHSSSPRASRYFEAAIFLTCHGMNLSMSHLPTTFYMYQIYLDKSIYDVRIFMYILISCSTLFTRLFTSLFIPLSRFASFSHRFMSLHVASLRFVASGCPAGLGRSVGGAPCRPCPEGTYSEEGESCDFLWLSDRPKWSKWNAAECNGMQWCGNMWKLYQIV